MAIEVKIYVSEAAALRAGHARAGERILRLDDAAVASLTPEQREELAGEKSSSRAYGHVSSDPRVADATLEALQAILDARIDKRRADHEAAVAGVLALEPEKLLSGWATANYLGERHIPWGDPRLAAKLGQVRAEGQRREAAWRAEKEEQKKQDAERRNREIAAQKEREAAERAAAERLAAGVAEWVAERGSPSQRARLAEGLLPQDEVIDAVREELFAPLADLPRYQRIEEMELDCSCEAGMACRVEGAAALDDSEYARLSQVRKLAPQGADVRAVLHVCECRSCDETVERPAASVRVEWAGRPLSREYAL